MNDIGALFPLSARAYALVKAAGIAPAGGETFSLPPNISADDRNSPNAYVPYKGSGPLMIDIRGGHVMMAFDSVSALALGAAS
jgi:tripartite-type tricarboxylate transporter receptor subunit TctC